MDLVGLASQTPPGVPTPERDAVEELFPEDDLPSPKALITIICSVSKKIVRKAAKKLKEEWEKQNNRPWPKDPDTGKDKIAHHDKPLADGGKDEAKNISPLSQKDHMQHHKDNGDFVRWGARSRSK